MQACRKDTKDVAFETGRAKRFDLGELCLETALVISSITPAGQTAGLLAVGMVAGSAAPPQAY